MKATILGAGYMGTAMVFPLVESGVEVNLWGTWLDDDLIRGARDGEHPRLKRSLPDSVGLFMSQELEEALMGIDILFMGVSSEGFVPVFEEALKALRDPVPVFTLTKGFSVLRGSAQRTSSAAATLFRERFVNDELHWASIGGPVKAFELARGVPSPAIYATTSSTSAEIGSSFQTDYYRVRTTEDVAGVELCSALKNVYAVGVGLCDGLYEQRMPRNYHNFSSLLFNQSVSEMAIVLEEIGALRETAYDLAGVGDPTASKALLQILDNKFKLGLDFGELDIRIERQNEKMYAIRNQNSDVNHYLELLDQGISLSHEQGEVLAKKVANFFHHNN